MEIVNGIKGAPHGEEGGRVRMRLKVLKPSKPIQLHPGITPLPAPWPNPWDHQDKTYAARCPRCGRDWSQPMSLYCPTCMGASSEAQTALSQWRA